MFVGTEIRPPSRGRTPTPPPAPVHSVGAVRSPDPARGGNVPARGIPVFLHLLLHRCRRVT